ncbi:type II toxin-antitoxin system VapC family toxin [Thermococcus argininiproducens]|uniref:Type II toxin-antitoxin system VapC family toxin n=1 Tax=Thermococcus argininiproducens TaxID=2866384 RepID=A0A9E7MB81_9EURY|nr:type II toxin-antitoxin system VapC family toxin [Thermococcus argininiproducens]USH00441.1 type II toxin-antitoxin system VapC family toxin [Thermococcus argininiproducens]
MIVIDSSAFSKFLLKEEGWEKVIPYLDPNLEPYAVDMLTIETTNVIWKYMKRYRLITREQAMGLYGQMVKLIREEVITLETGRKYLQEALKIAVDYDISIYDGLFLAQARNLKAKLVTSDKKQRDVAEKIGLEVAYVNYPALTDRAL